MNDLMLDLETMGNEPGSAIVEIGAVYFSRSGEIGERFQVRISLEDCMREGLTVNASTINWWLTQSEEARRRITECEFTRMVPTSLRQALEAFHLFYKPRTLVWSHATFDFVLLQAAYRKLGGLSPMDYRCARDLRTLLDLARIDITKIPRVGTHHSAIDDCMFQVECCERAFTELGLA